MKAQLFDAKGERKSEITLPEVFESPIREDLATKFFEVEKEYQPYASYEEAGKRHSAAGRISHRRHKWRTAYGKGISRIPRKTMWRRGTQMHWIGAEVTSARGGRRAHPPKGIYSPRKMNKKEIKLAMRSAIASTANKEIVARRYASLQNVSSVPFVVESLPAKTKDVIALLRKIFGDMFSLTLKKKVVRAGRGKTRGRKYKSNAGLLLVTGKEEKLAIKGIDVRNNLSLKIEDLYPLGRLTLYTKKALEEIGGKKQ